MKYPDFKQLAEADKPNNLDGVKIDRASGGAIRTRSTWDKMRRVMTVKHILTPNKRDQLMSFYNSTRTGDARFDFEWWADGKTYQCVFAQTPEEQWIRTQKGVRWLVTCQLAEV